MRRVYKVQAIQSRCTVFIYWYLLKYLYSLLVTVYTLYTYNTIYSCYIATKFFRTLRTEHKRNNNNNN